MGDRVLVLGATGFLGGNIARSLYRAGHSVAAIRRPRSDASAIADVPVEWVMGDLRDRASLARAMEGADGVVHSAGHYPVSAADPSGNLRRGVEETRAVIAAARRAGARRFLYVSSLSTIGQPPAEEDRLADERDAYVPGTADSSYFEVKHAMEAEVYRAAARGLDAVIVNPTLCLGPGDVKPTSGRLVLEVARERVPFYVDALVNAVHVEDVADAAVAAYEKGGTGERYILGNENLRLFEVFRLIAKEAGVAPPRFEIPYRSARVVATASEAAAKFSHRVGERLVRYTDRAERLMRPPRLPLEALDLLAHSQPLSVDKARIELGMRATPVTRAIRDALQYFRDRGMTV